MTEAFADVLGGPLRFSPVYIPTLPNLILSDAERAIISKLQARMWRQRYIMELKDAYYRGLQIITSLGIAMPPELDGKLRSVVGWPATAVDPYVERLGIDSFTLDGEDDPDPTIQMLLDENGFDAELPLAFTDALVMGRSWFTLGSRPNYTLDDPTIPDICVESPLNVSVAWDVRSAQPKELLQSYWLDERRHAALLLPNQTICIGEDDNGIWQLVDRDVHNLGWIPARRMAYMPRSNNRDGTSAITPALMYHVDAACRALVNMEVAGEFYSVPQKYILGAVESDFKNADGSTKTAWQTYISNVLAIDTSDDEDSGEQRQVKVGQFKTYDPSVFIKGIEFHAAAAAGILAAPPQDLGLYTDGNPVTAESAQVSESRRDRRARRMGRMFTPDLRVVVQMGVRWLHNGELPEKYRRINVNWLRPEIENFTGTADGINKLVTAGVWAADSDVTRKRSGLNAAERAQMGRELDKAQQIVDEIGSSVEGKAARAANALAKAATPDPTAPPAAE